MHSRRIWGLTVLVGLAGCVSQGDQPKHITSESVVINTTKTVTIHGTSIYYRDLSRPPQSEVAKSLYKNNVTQKKASSQAIALSKSHEQVKNKIEIESQAEIKMGVITRHQQITITPEKSLEPRSKVSNSFYGDNEAIKHQRSEPVTPPMTKRIVLNEVNFVGQYDNGRRGIKDTKSKRRISDNNHVGLWQWMFGKRKPAPKPTVVKVVSRPDAELLNQPNEVLFKHAKTDQLEDGQLDILLALSSQANTTAIYEVRGTAGYKGDKAERIGRERADFIKQTLMNAGVSRTKIRIMAYDPSFPGLRGVVTLRDGEAI